MSLAATVPNEAPNWFREWAKGMDRDTIFGTAILEQSDYTLESVKRDFGNFNTRMDKMDKDILEIKDDIKTIKKLLTNK